MSDTKPLVSVFIPYYNDKKFLARAIESVLAQSYKNIELVLLNHASTDNSRAIARSYADARIKHIDMKKNLGAGSGLLISEFLKVAEGEYAKLFCADDMLMKDCIETLLAFLKNNSNCDIVFGNMNYVDENEKCLGTTWAKVKPLFLANLDSANLLKKFFEGISFLPYPASLLKTDTLRQADIDKSFIMQTDMTIWVDLLIKGKKIACLEKPVVNYRIHEEQMSSSNRKAAIYRMSSFESLKYCDYFYKIKDASIIKTLCANSSYSSEITDKDSDFFEFLIAHHHLKGKNETYKINGYTHMHALMQNDTMREKIEKRFAFGIKEFRELYSSPLPHTAKPKELGIPSLLYLVQRRLWIIITFKEFKRKRRKKYTE